jgi:transposase-like protein
MKGRDGGRMTIYGVILPRAALVARLAVASPAARQRLKISRLAPNPRAKSELTSRRFGIQRLTLRRWVKRARLGGIEGLNDRSHRPRRLRAMTTPWQTLAAVAECRKRYPAWSKYKITAVLRSGSVMVSASTVGRIPFASFNRNSAFCSLANIKRKAMRFPGWVGRAEGALLPRTCLAHFAER